MTDILAYLNEQEIKLGAKEVREACRRYLLKKTTAGILPTRRKPIPRSWLIDAYAKQSGKCKRCGNQVELSEASGDHIIALALGGHHNRHNIQMLHRSCNSAKGANDLIRESKLTGVIVSDQLGDEI